MKSLIKTFLGIFIIYLNPKGMYMDEQETYDLNRCYRELALEFSITLLSGTETISASKVLGVALDFERYLNGSMSDSLEDINKYLQDKK